jgi:glycogen debranching enzyme
LRLWPQPLLLSSTVHDDNAVFATDLTNPDLFGNGELLLPRDTLHIQRLKFMWQGSCHERVTVRNYDAGPRSAVLTLRFESDFADLFEVRGSGASGRPACCTNCVAALRYSGLMASSAMTVHFTPHQRGSRSLALYEFALILRTAEIFMEFGCSLGAEQL